MKALSRAIILGFIMVISTGTWADSVRVMTFNLWVGGEHSGLNRPDTIKAQLAAIEAARADIVGLQEQSQTSSSTALILSNKLGWNHYIISSSRAVLSRWPLEPLPVRVPQPGKDPRTSGNNSQAVMIRHPNGKSLAFGVVHLEPAPYEPYEIVDGNFNRAQEAVRSARQTRLHQARSILHEMESQITSGVPSVILGDFNEPPCLDWTSETVAMRRDPAIPFAVQWPTTRLLIDSGFVDAFRAIHPDAIKKPGFTWTPRPDPHRNPEVMDRIDMIFVTSKNAKVLSASVVGEPGPMTDIPVSPWTSDHRAVVATIDF